MFDEHHVAASFISTSLIRCVAPHVSVASSVPVRVALNGVEFRDKLSYTFIAPIRIESIEPSLGPEFGGTLVTLSGENFPSVDIYCVFGDKSQVIGMKRSRTKVECISPNHMPKYVSVKLVYCGMDKHLPPSLGRPFEYTSGVSLSSIEPSSGSCRGSTEVTIFGVNFLNTTKLSCSFSNISVHATYVSPIKIMCFSPPSHLPTSSVLTVSNNGQDFEGRLDNILFSYYLDPVIDSISPRTAPWDGGTMLTISGYGFGSTEFKTAVCKIGASISQGYIFNATAILCETPPLNIDRPQSVLVEISFNGGADFVRSEKATIFVHAKPTIDSVYPLSVPEIGGSTIFVTGLHFHRSSVLSCQFGSNLFVQAELITRTVIKCVTPALAPGYANVTISSNGQDAGKSAPVMIWITNLVTVTSIHPPSGSWLGGTPLTLTGTGFSDWHTQSFQCIFGNNETSPIIVLDSTMAQCRSPPPNKQLSSKVALKVLVNGVDIVDSGLSFQFERPPRIEKFHPTVGPLYNSTAVSIFGGGFRTVAQDKAPALCSFGEHSAPANIISDSQVTCFTPTMEYSESQENHKLVNVNVGVSVNGVDFVYSSERFVFYQEPTVTNIYPNSGSEFGGSVVTISGANFVRSDNFTCMFGGVRSPVSNWLSHKEVTCLTPQPLYGMDNGFLSVQVGVLPNGQSEALSDLIFTYQSVGNIEKIVPRLGAIEGGTLLHLHGNGFLLFGGMKAFCCFGPSRKLIPASVQSSSVTSCIVPPASTYSKVEVSLSLNDGHDLVPSSSSLLYSYVRPVTLSSLSPQFTPSNGGSKITVIGKNFLDSNATSVVCLVGGKAAIGEVLNNTALSFFSPSFDFGKEIVDVFVSINGGVDYNSHSLQLGLLPSPKLSAVVPPFSHELGGGYITISGSDFFSTIDLTCIFAKGDKIVSSLARAVTSEKVVCQIPPHAEAGLMKLQVSLTGAYHSEDESLDFSYFPALALSSISPSVGNTLGGTKVTVTGTGFQATDQNYVCVFGRSSNNVTASKATYISQNKLSCYSPPSTNHLPVQVLFSVMTLFSDLVFDAGIGDGATHLYTYKDSILISSITPSSGLFSGGTKIEMIGANFVNSDQLLCHFVFVGGIIYVPALYHSENFLTCYSPSVGLSMDDQNSQSAVVMVSNSVDLPAEVGFSTMLAMCVHLCLTSSMFLSLI